MKTSRGAHAPWLHLLLLLTGALLLLRLPWTAEACPGSFYPNLGSEVSAEAWLLPPVEVNASGIGERCGFLHVFPTWIEERRRGPLATARALFGLLDGPCRNRRRPLCEKRN